VYGVGGAAKKKEPEDNDDKEPEEEEEGEGAGEDNEREGDCTNWDNGDSKGGDAPESLFCGGVERKIPPCTMNAAKRTIRGEACQYLEY